MTDAGIHILSQIQDPYAEWEEELSKGGFLAEILDHGPNDEEDYEDARYWVRELVETSAADTAVTEPLSLSNDALIASEYPVRYVTATNLAELGPDTHGLTVDDTTIVRVSMLRSADGTARFYFERGSGAGLVEDWFDYDRMGRDHIVCTRISTGERFVNVAKPNELRVTPWDNHGQFQRHVDAFVIYAYPDLQNPDTRQARILGGETVVEVVAPIYDRGPYGMIWAVRIGEERTGVSGAEWLDRNLAGRVWAVRRLE
jgi:hypothetical protein